VDKELKEINLKRHNPVGKKMGSKVWAHIQYIEDIVPEHKLKTVFNSMDFRSVDFPLSLFRYDLKTDEISFIECSDFNTKSEPTIGRIYTFSDPQTHLSNGLNIKKPEKNPFIYHHKWMFVKDDYSGFDVNKSKKRSLLWKNILGVNKSISNKIGRNSFWSEWTKDNGIFEK